MKEIYDLAQEGQRLGTNIAWNFALLLNQEVLICIGTQATRYEKIASGSLDCSAAYYSIMHAKGEGMSAEHTRELDAVVDRLCTKMGQVWLDTNSTLFKHALRYDDMLCEFFNESSNALRV